MDENLSKWLNGELTDDQLKEKIGSEEALKFIQIVGEVDQWVPDNAEKLFEPKEITSRPKAKVRTMRPWYTYAAAAAVLLTVVSYLWVLLGDTTVTYSSQVGEVREVQLPDGSSVTLAPNSEISWDESEWDEAIAMKENRLKSKKAARKVKMKGKALFKVEKGAPFTVSSPSGSVRVLGTTFEVDDFENGMNVACYEGRVEAKPKTIKKSVTVSGGESYLFYKNRWEEKKTVSGSGPAWLQNQTKFENAPLAQVIKTLEKLYGVSIQQKGVNTSRRFTGTIPNDKLDVALKIVFTPFNITFEKKGDQVILSDKN